MNIESEFCYFIVTSSLPATLGGAPITPPPQPDLPSYDQCIPSEDFSWSGGGGGVEEPQMDENERIALQEAEDERLAREMMQSEDNEVRGGRREGGEEGGGREGKEGVS